MIVVVLPIFLLGTALISFAQSPRIQIQIGQKEYQTGDIIMVTGNIGILRENQVPVIQIFNPNGVLYRADQVQMDTDGSYSYEFKVGGKIGISGTYHVVITYGTSQAETSFRFTSYEAKTVNVVIDGKTYPIRVRGGHFPSWLRSISANPQTLSLVMTLDGVTEDAQVQMELDSSLINTNAECFIVYADDEQVPAECNQVDNDTTSLTFMVPRDSKELRIVGTFLAPEFGSIAAVLLALTIAAIILASTKYHHINGNKSAALP